MKMQIIESMLSYSNGFEKTSACAKKIKNIALETIKKEYKKILTTMDDPILQGHVCIEYFSKLVDYQNFIYQRDVFCKIIILEQGLISDLHNKDELIGYDKDDKYYIKFEFKK